MSDQSSESGGDSWVFVNKTDDISLEEDETQPLNSELNYGSVCLAASDSIQSSLSSEELEWQYEHLENGIDLLSYCSSHVEDLYLDDSQNGHDENHNLDQTEDIDLSSYSSSINYKEEADIDIASVHKMHSYKHNRNDRLNFILNIMLALTVSSALGLGTGHFLGWSHKCWKNIPYFNDAGNHIVPGDSLINQIMQDFLSAEKEIENSPASLQDLQEVFDLPPKVESDSMPHETCKKTLSKSGINGVGDIIFPNYVSSNSDILELSVSNVVKQNNFSDSEYLIPSEIIRDWSDLSQITLPVKSLNEQVSHFSDETALERNEDMNPSDKGIYLQSNFFNEYGNKNKDSNKGANFTTELRKDLTQVVQTLNAITLTCISSDKEMSVEDLGLIAKLYKDLEIIINTKISYMDAFIHSEDYKKYPKFRLKYMHKMVYSLIDTFEYVMKINMKTFGNDYKQVNSFKFSKNVSKIISNFDKRWEKNLKSWSVRVEKAKAREHKNVYHYNEKTFKREKKYRKRRVQFDNDSYKMNKYKRHFVKY